MKLFILITLLNISAIAASETADDISTDNISDGAQILARSRISVKTGGCKYKKGKWSKCDEKVMVS